MRLGTSLKHGLSRYFALLGVTTIVLLGVLLGLAAVIVPGLMLIKLIPN
jgi:hypothetical protein